MYLKSFVSISMALLVLLFLVSCGTESQQAGKPHLGDYQVVDAKAFMAMSASLDSPQIIDVRTGGEYAASHIPGAINISIADRSFAETASKLDQDRPVLVYCTVGARSRNASKILQQVGFLQIIELEGGINAWYRAQKKK